ncbi:MAG: DNA topoisomerase 3 [Alphaproteobacteria bacterium]|nr:DNA topoisomerase 3 [Alphaproteobacteria bacterium]
MAGHRLILAEKPSVARDIARALGVRGRRDGWIEGGDWRVSWCLGHLVELEEPKGMDPAWSSWRLDTLPMLPEVFSLRVRAGAEDQWGVVRKLLRDPDLIEVINACDAGREGELIFAYVYELSGCTAPVRRLWVSSMTERAIREGMERLRPGAALKDLEDAARCRSEADWLVGLNATRAMTVAVRELGGGGLLSLGRVQTPVLAMIVDREREITSFEPQDFWQLKVTLEATTGAAAGERWEATWTGRDAEGKPVDRLFERPRAEALAAAVDGQGAVVTEVQRKKKREPPPLLYDLTTLQREANARLGISARRCLDVLQALYERHKVVTYPRTDSRHLGSDMVPLLPGLVKALDFGPYAAASADILSRWPVTLGDRVIDDAEVSDHHAIIPTGTDPRACGLSPLEKRVFDLVARRFLAVFLPDAVFATATVDAVIAEALFRARGRQRLEAGWQTIDPPRSSGKRAEVVLPAVDTGDRAAQVGLEIKDGQTRPPKRYTEATLLGAMERAGEKLDEAELRRAMKRSGLGTPATRAAIIETLIQRGYVLRDARDLLPSPQGCALIDALPVEALRSPRLTGAWEARLVAMTEGQEARAGFMADIRRFTAEAVEALKATRVAHDVARILSPPQEAGEVLGACPRCGGSVRRQGPGWRCDGCPLYIHGQVARREVSVRMARALLQSGQTPVVKGFRSKEGKRFAAALALDAEGKVVFHFPEPEALGPCPACGTPVRARGKVYTCDTGRDCAFVVFQEMSGRAIAEDEVRRLLKDGEAGPFDDFKTRDGEAFTGALRWEDGRVRVRRADRREGAGAVGACPRCGAAVGFAGGDWRCGGCDFRIPGTVARRPIRAEDAQALLKDGRTGRLYGFRQSGGALFRAACVLDPGGGVQLDFAGGSGPREAPPGGPAPAFGEVVDCPVCVHAGSLEPGYVVRGRAAWGCSRWREGCRMTLPFVVSGLALPEDEARRFFDKARATRYLKGFTGAEAAGRSCRVTQRLEEEPCWVLEPRRR